MKRRGVQLSRGHRQTLYTASVTLFISGAAWAWANHLDTIAQTTEAVRHFKLWLLRIHGFSAMAFVLLLGTLLPGHVRRAWRARQNRGNGACFLTSISLLTLSGYALYYLGGEELRNATSQFHLWLGVASPALLVWHIRSGRRSF